MPTFLVVGTQNWKRVQRALRAEHRQDRCSILSGFGADAGELTMRCFGLTNDPLSPIEQLGQTYGFGPRSVWTPAVTVIGVLEYLGVLGNGYQAPPRAKAYAVALERAINRMKAYMTVPSNRLERVLLHEFGIADLDRLPIGLPLCEVPALAAICANPELLSRLRAGANLIPAQEALRRRFGFDQGTAASFRTYRSVAASMHGSLPRVRSDIEIELRALGIETL